MRRVVVGLSACLVMLIPLCRADATVVRGTGGGSPWLTNGARCDPTAADLDLETDRGLPTRAGEVPRTPVPGLTPESGSRYLQYDGNPGYGRGMLLQFSSGDLPTAMSVRAAAPSGTSYAIPIVIAVTYDPALADGGNASTGAMEYVGIANRAHWQRIGAGWTTATVDFDSTSTFTWFAWNQTDKFQNGGQWSAGSNVLYYPPRAGWQSRIGFLFGCGDNAPVDVDLLSATSSKSGTQTFDFEGLPSSVSAVGSTSEVTYGKPVTISATASQGSTPAAVPLRLVRCQGATCQFLGDPVTSSPSAPVSFTLHPEPGWTYGVRYDGDGTFGPAQADVAIGVRSKLVVALSQRRAHVGDTVTVGGQIGPCTGTRRKLAIQRFVHGSWRTVGHAQAPKCAVIGRHQFKAISGHVRVSSLGRWKLRVVAPAAGGSATTYSHTLRLSVTRAPVRHVATVHYTAPVTHTSPTSTTAAPPPPV